jgi:hypothetical protein
MICLAADASIEWLIQMLKYCQREGIIYFNVELEPKLKLASGKHFDLILQV